MQIFYLFLFLIYATIPPLAINRTLNLIYIKKDKYGWHYQYLVKYLSSFSFLPLLFIPNLNLALVPQRSVSIIAVIAVFVLSFFLLPYARKKKVIFIYTGGIFAAFMEEILFRGVLFGLAMLAFNNQWIALILTSLAFGGWHLKNIPWAGKKGAIRQFFYTALYAGPMFALIRIITGDIYLSILIHFIMDTSVALAPAWTRGWLVFGRLGKNDRDDFDKNSN
jgi:membrane protease YdiL (CAAX protease family)